jgi:hypothetical protein
MFDNFFSENHAVYELMLEKRRIKGTKMRKHSHNICYLLLSIVTMFKQTRLNDALYLQCLSCLN